ncbi:alpha-L-arabinofuranosidase C-terminal domain-containing protein [Paenibacillus oryzisoli]|uniref:alpha-N-arabinofuranosidase n=1 Tax=Paenibacillus oryzisoli TaxID=1850517 RepID=UPI003D293C55
MKARLSVHMEDRLGEVSPYIYGQYFEHLGNCIYPSVWDDQSPYADEAGNRLDVIEAVKELNAPVVRWPGGCYVDLYDWHDGVGPRSERPARVNWHWGGIESNKFGTDEFLQWCEKAGTEPYVNVNLGTGTLVEALRWVDYCNGTGETADAQWRIANGRQEPYNVKLWGIGNETWGDWEAGQLSAAEYAHKLANWAQFFKKYDPSLRLLGVGSHNGSDADWDRSVMVQAGKYLDYLTFHLYGCSMDRESGAEYYPIVFTPVYFEGQLRKMVEVIKAAAAAKPNERPVQISMDEWNIRHYEPNPEDGGYRLNRNSPRNLQDALFVAGVFNTMIRLSPVVGMANYVFLVNGNGVISVTDDRVIRTTLFHVFKQYAAWMTGQSVRVDLSSRMMRVPAPRINGPELTEKLKDVHEPSDAPFVDAVAVLQDNGDLNIALVNRHQTDAAELDLQLPDNYRLANVWTLTHEDIYAANTAEQPDRIVPDVRIVESAEADRRAITVPPHTVVLFNCNKP